MDFLNCLRRFWVILREDGHIVHYGDGKDFILVREFQREWVSENAFTCEGPERYGQYLRDIGFKEVRVSNERVFRYKCTTSLTDIVWTRKMYH